MSRPSPAPWLVVALASLLLLGASTYASANLLTNGSFESGPATGGSILPLANGSTALPPWEVSRGDVDYVGGAYWVAQDANCSLALNGTQAGGVAQSFSTVPGGLYRASFYLSGDPFSTPAVKHVRVAAAGSSADFSFDTSVAWEWDMHWVLETWDFHAAANTTTLELYSLDDGSDTGPVIDNVAVDLISLVDAPATSLADFSLAPGAPNPTAGPTRIAWAVPRAAHVTLGVYDVNGRAVAVLADREMAPGNYSVSWDARSAVRRAPPGLYFIRLEALGRVFMRRLAVVQ